MGEVYRGRDPRLDRDVAIKVLPAHLAASPKQRERLEREAKAETVRLVRAGRTVAEVARDLDLTESALRNWVHQGEVDAGRGEPGELTTAEREELHRLRREVKSLRLDREILKKAAAFFAKENG
jgi:transposase